MPQIKISLPPTKLCRRFSPPCVGSWLRQFPSSPNGCTRTWSAGWDNEAPESVHLCDYPTVDEALLDPELNDRMAVAQQVVRLGHKLREECTLRVRQPLAELRFASPNDTVSDSILQLDSVIREELNVKKLTACPDLDELVSYSYKPNLKTLGPRYGKLLGLIRKELPALDSEVLAPLRSGHSVNVTLGGQPIELSPEDVLVSTEQAADWACGDDQGLQVALSTQLTDELVREGMGRDFVRHVQQLRKNADLQIEDRIEIQFSPASDSNRKQVDQMIAEWGEFIRSETLATRVSEIR